MNKLKYYLLPIAVLAFFGSCKKEFLDKEPISTITPESYLRDESHLAAYAIAQYGVFPTHGQWDYGTFALDANTDNLAAFGYHSQYVPGELRTGQAGGAWDFSTIFKCNYFLNTVLPRWQNNEITGNATNINHYIGEMYFIRAYEYFSKVRDLGDFPIIKTILPDEINALTEASKRMPHAEVVRFIITDLDSAITLLQETAPDGKRNRIGKAAAQLFKSRVALYEATWLKYFKGTAFVPNGPDWPGAQKEYNKNYQFQAGSIDDEVNWLLDQAMDAAAAVADRIPLVENTGTLPQTASDPLNPYLVMFGDVDMSAYPEILLWRSYNRSLGISNNVPVAAAYSNDGNGLTRGYVESFVMANGLPIYAAGSGYAGDDYISDVRENRDGRLWLFLKEPGQVNLLFNTSQGTHKTPIEPTPNITATAATSKYRTGYAVRKGINYDGQQYDNGQSSTGCIVFRAVEAYLNYMEANYERHGALDGKAQQYWKAIRTRAKVDPDYAKTIAATDMNQEAENDWGAYSAGQLVDATLYNIRRERRCELLNEALRDLDLRRWRAKDQLMNTPYHIEGFKLWGPMKDWYSDLNYGTANGNVSDPARSEYLRPYEITGKETVYNGYSWAMAHYWQPIALQHFQITAQNGDLNTSPIYQNPGWPLGANLGALY
jgi:SusD family.